MGLDILIIDNPDSELAKTITEANLMYFLTNQN